MSTSLNQLNEELQQKISDYESTLDFIQNELIQDRGKLARAKHQSQPKEVIDLILDDIEKLEKGIDQYQEWLAIFRKQLQTNED